MVILIGDELHEIELEADAQAKLDERFVVCFTCEALFLALKAAEVYGAKIIVCGEHGKRASLHFDPAPCRCGRPEQSRGKAT